MTTRELAAWISVYSLAVGSATAFILTGKSEFLVGFHSGMALLLAVAGHILFRSARRQQ